MADIIEKLVVEIGADIAGFMSGAADVVRQSEQTGSRIDQAFARAGQGLNRLGGGMMRLGAGLTAGVTAPLLLFARSAVSAWNDSEQALAQVRAALRSTGEAAGRSMEQLQAEASALQRMTLFDDDDILRDVTANLLKFPTITTDVFDRAQRDILDFAQRSERDLASATQVIARALADPVAGMVQLKRAGVTLSDEIQASIRDLIEQGKLREAQLVLLQGLEIAYGDSARAAAEAGLGPLQQVQNEWDDIKETIGGFIVEVLPSLVAQLRNLVGWLRELNPETLKWSLGILGVAAAMGPALTIVGGLLKLLGALLAGGALITGVVAGIAAVGAAYLIFKEDINTAISEAVGIVIDYRRQNEYQLDLLKTAWAAAWSLIVDTVETKQQEVASGAGGFWETLFLQTAQEKWAELMGWLGEQISSLGSTMLDWAVGGAMNTGSFLLYLINGARQDFTDFITWLSDQIIGLPGNIYMWATGITQAGEDIIQALWDGFTGKMAELGAWFAAQIEEKILGPLRAAKDAVINFFGAAGPALVAPGLSTGPMGGPLSGGNIGGQIGAGVGGAIPRAGGGPVQAGKSFMVGEKGPELFTPGRSGQITPNSAMGSMGGGFAGMMAQQFAMLAEIIRSPIPALDELIAAFQYMSDEVVGHSIVPEMMDQIVDWFVKTNDIIVDDTTDAAALVAQAYAAAAASAKDAMGQMLNDVKKIGSTLFGESKGWAIAEIIINTAQAIMKALSTYPPPFSYAAAATAAAAGAAQLATVRSTTKGSGNVGGVGAAPVSPTMAGSTPQYLFVQGIDPNQLFSGMQVRELSQKLLDYQRNGGKVVFDE